MRGASSSLKWAAMAALVLLSIAVTCRAGRNIMLDSAIVVDCGHEVVDSITMTPLATAVRLVNCPVLSPAACSGFGLPVLTLGLLHLINTSLPCSFDLGAQEIMFHNATISGAGPSTITNVGTEVVEVFDSTFSNLLIAKTRLTAARSTFSVGLRLEALTDDVTFEDVVVTHDGTTTAAPALHIASFTTPKAVSMTGTSVTCTTSSGLNAGVACLTIANAASLTMSSVNVSTIIAIPANGLSTAAVSFTATGNNVDRVVSLSSSNFVVAPPTGVGAPTPAVALAGNVRVSITDCTVTKRIPGGPGEITGFFLDGAFAVTITRVSVEGSAIVEFGSVTPPTMDAVFMQMAATEATFPLADRFSFDISIVESTVTPATGPCAFLAADMKGAAMAVRSSACAEPWKTRTDTAPTSSLLANGPGTKFHLVECMTGGLDRSDGKHTAFNDTHVQFVCAVTKQADVMAIGVTGSVDVFKTGIAGAPSPSNLLSALLRGVAWDRVAISHFTDATLTLHSDSQAQGHIKDLVFSTAESSIAVDIQYPWTMGSDGEAAPGAPAASVEIINTTSASVTVNMTSIASIVTTGMSESVLKVTDSAWGVSSAWTEKESEITCTDPSTSAAWEMKNVRVFNTKIEMTGRRIGSFSIEDVTLSNATLLQHRDGVAFANVKNVYHVCPTSDGCDSRVFLYAATALVARDCSFVGGAVTGSFSFVELSSPRVGLSNITVRTAPGKATSTFSSGVAMGGFPTDPTCTPFSADASSQPIELLQEIETLIATVTAQTLTNCFLRKVDVEVLDAQNNQAFFITVVDQTGPAYIVDSRFVITGQENVQAAQMYVTKDNLITLGSTFSATLTADRTAGVADNSRAIELKFQRIFLPYGSAADGTTVSFYDCEIVATRAPLLMRVHGNTYGLGRTVVIARSDLSLTSRLLSTVANPNTHLYLVADTTNVTLSDNRFLSTPVAVPVAVVELGGNPNNNILGFGCNRIGGVLMSAAHRPLSFFSSFGTIDGQCPDATKTQTMTSPTITQTPDDTSSPTITKTSDDTPSPTITFIRTPTVTNESTPTNQVNDTDSSSSSSSSSTGSGNGTTSGASGSGSNASAPGSSSSGAASSPAPSSPSSSGHASSGAVDSAASSSSSGSTGGPTPAPDASSSVGTAPSSGAQASSGAAAQSSSSGSSGSAAPQPQSSAGSATPAPGSEGSTGTGSSGSSSSQAASAPATPAPSSVGSSSVGAASSSSSSSSSEGESPVLIAPEGLNNTMTSKPIIIPVEVNDTVLVFTNVTTSADVNITAPASAPIVNVTVVISQFTGRNLFITGSFRGGSIQVENSTWFSVLHAADTSGARLNFSTSVVDTAMVVTGTHTNVAGLTLAGNTIKAAGFHPTGAETNHAWIRGVMPAVLTTGPIQTQGTAVVSLSENVFGGSVLFAAPVTALAGVVVARNNTVTIQSANADSMMAVAFIHVSGPLEIKENVVTVTRSSAVQGWISAVSIFSTAASHGVRIESNDLSLAEVPGSMGELVPIVLYNIRHVELAAVSKNKIQLKTTGGFRHSPIVIGGVHDTVTRVLVSGNDVKFDTAASLCRSLLAEVTPDFSAPVLEVANNNIEAGAAMGAAAPLLHIRPASILADFPQRLATAALHSKQGTQSTHFPFAALNANGPSATEGRTVHALAGSRPVSILFECNHIGALLSTAVKGFEALFTGSSTTAKACGSDVPIGPRSLIALLWGSVLVAALVAIFFVGAWCVLRKSDRPLDQETIKRRRAKAKEGKIIAGADSDEELPPHSEFAAILCDAKPRDKSKAAGLVAMDINAAEGSRCRRRSSVGFGQSTSTMGGHRQSRRVSKYAATDDVTGGLGFDDSRRYSGVAQGSFDAEVELSAAAAASYMTSSSNASRPFQTPPPPGLPGGSSVGRDLNPTLTHSGVCLPNDVSSMDGNRSGGGLDDVQLCFQSDVSKNLRTPIEYVQELGSDDPSDDAALCARSPRSPRRGLRATLSGAALSDRTLTHRSLALSQARSAISPTKFGESRHLSRAPSSLVPPALMSTDNTGGIGIGSGVSGTPLRQQQPTGSLVRLLAAPIDVEPPASLRRSSLQIKRTVSLDSSENDIGDVQLHSIARAAQFTSQDSCDETTPVSQALTRPNSSDTAVGAPAGNHDQQQQQQQEQRHSRTTLFVADASGSAVPTNARLQGAQSHAADAFRDALNGESLTSLRSGDRRHSA